MTPLRILTILIAVLLASKSLGDQHPNVLLIVSDDQRPDTVAALGNKVIQTRTLDRLVREGCVMTRATCANPICTPSRAEVLTGCSGFRNGVLDFGGKVNTSLPTMADWFRKAGYRTCYVGKWHNDGRPDRTRLRLHERAVPWGRRSICQAAKGLRRKRCHRIPGLDLSG